jgi:hypothetical protein
MSFPEWLQKNEKYIMPLILVGFILLVFSNYAYLLPVDFRGSCDEGDIGRDLYYFYLVSKGQLPYIDFNWIYGPLSTVLNGITFKIFGVSAFNALTLWYITYVIAIFLVYYLVKSFYSPSAGCLAGVLFIVYYESLLIPVFNHVTGLPFVILSLLFIKRYLENQTIKYLYIIAILCFLLCITKLNIGIAFTVTLFFCLILFDFINKRDLKVYTGPLLTVTGLTTLVYGFLIFNSPLDQLAKSFPYGSDTHMVSSKSLLESLFEVHKSFIYGYDSYILTNPILEKLFYLFTFNIWYFVVILIGFIVSFKIFKNEGKQSISMAYIMTLSILALSLTHEFILTGKTNSLKAWSLSVIIPLSFYIFKYARDKWHDHHDYKQTIPVLRIILILCVAVKSIVFLMPAGHTSSYCKNDRLKISVLHEYWYETMNNCVEYIQSHTNENEKVLTLPYNSLYNFISRRDHPSRYNEFLWITGITEQDQHRVIDDLEKNKVRLIMYTIKRSIPEAGGFGTFGVTHCEILDKYIKDNYHIDESFKSSYFGIHFYHRNTDFKE